MKVRLEFRFGLNKREEKNTDYLVDKSFKPNGDTIIEEINKDKTGTWFFGEPMEFALRWADGDEQADKPTYDQNDPDIEIEGNTARIICVGNWSLLRFIQKYKSTSNSVDNLNKNENLLTFRVPLSSGKIAKVSAGVTASLPKKPGDPSITTLKIPDTPGEMPEISEYVKSVANESVLVENSIGNVEIPDTDQDIVLKKTNEQQETDDNEEKDDVVEQEDEIEQHVEKQISNKKIKQNDNKQKKEAPKQQEKRTRKQSNISKLPETKQQTMDQQVDKILSSESIDEEPMIEISEQPIE